MRHIGTHRKKERKKERERNTQTRERELNRQREKLRVNALVSKINLGRAEENLNSIRIFHA